MREIAPVVVIDGKILEEGKDFRIEKLPSKGVRFWIAALDSPLDLRIEPSGSGEILLPGEKKDWPRFYFNERPVMPMSVFSHMQGQFPGVTIRFVGEAIGMLQLIPRLMDPKLERELDKKEYEYYFTHGGFTEDYFKRHHMMPDEHPNDAN